jgi:hypothetical protein
MVSTHAEALNALNFGHAKGMYVTKTTYSLIINPKVGVRSVTF